MIQKPNRVISNTLWQKLFKVLDENEWNCTKAMDANPYKWKMKRKQWDEMCLAVRRYMLAA